MRLTDPALTPRMPARMGKAADLVYKTASDHAMVALRIPVHVASQIAIKGGEPVANLHCTLVYLGDVAEINPDNLRSLCGEWLPAVGNVTPPLQGRITGYGRFAPNEDEDVIWAGLDAPDLAELRHLVLQAVKNAGIVPVNDHGFTPHITLAYVEPGEGEDSMPPNVDVEIRYLSVTVGDSEVMIPLMGDKEVPAQQPVLPSETFSDLQGPSVEFTRARDLERWAQNKGSLMVRADVPGIGCVVVKKGTDISIGVEGWDGSVMLGDLIGALGAIKHDVIMVGRLSAWDTATESWVDGDDTGMPAVLTGERVAAPVFFAADLLVLDGDISRQPARERFERLRVVVAPAGGAVVVPRQIECTTKMDLADCVDEVAEWQPSDREGGWYCPGVTVVESDSPYAHGTSEHEVRLILRLRKDEGLIGIGSGGGVTERPMEVIDDRIRKPHFPDIRPIAKGPMWDESKHPRDPGGEDGGQFTSGGGAGDAGEFRDPALPATADAVVVGPSEEAKAYLKQIDSDPKVQAARKDIAETVETITTHKRGKQWTADRAKLHEKIVAEMLNPAADVPEGETPTATFLMGLPASGKSGVLKPTIANLDKATVIDPDAVKDKLPEYNGKNAAAVHMESGEIAEGPLLHAALRRNQNIVLDLVGKNQDKMITLAYKLKASGYEVDLRHVTLPPLEAAKRAMGRYDQTGRFVDPSYIINDVGSRSDATYEALKNSGILRNWESYDNSGPFGSKPTRRERGAAGSAREVRRGADGTGDAGEVPGGEVVKEGVAGGTFGTAGTHGILAPQQGMFRKPKRSRNVNKREIRTDLTLLKAWTDEARAAALEARRHGGEGTVAGEDWKYPNPMADMAEYDPTPNDEPRVRIKPNIWHPRKWADGDSFAVGYGVVGGHTFRPGTLKDGQFVPDKKQPRVNPYESIFQRKGVLLGLGTVTKSAIDQAQQDREQRERKEYDQAAIVGALVAMSERGVPEHMLAVEVAKIGWTDEARAKALETRRRNAMNAGKKPKPYVDPDPPRTEGGPNEFKTRMRDANGEALIGMDGQVYSGGPHAKMSASLGYSIDTAIEAGFVRARIDDGVLSAELMMDNPKAKEAAKALVSAHGKDSNIFIDNHVIVKPTTPAHEQVKGSETYAFQQPGAVGKALRFLDTGDTSEAKVWKWKNGIGPTPVERAAVWDESKHPRDPGGEGGGQFTAGGGSAGGAYSGTGAVIPEPEAGGAPVVGDHQARGAALEAKAFEFYSPIKGHGNMNRPGSSYSGAQRMITGEARKGMQTEAAKAQAGSFQWAWTYGKGDPMADLLLLAAQKEYGGDVYHRGYPGKSAPKVTDPAALAKSSWEEFTSTATKNPSPGNPMPAVPVEQGLADFGEYLKIQYAATQAHLKSSPDQVTLYRGMSTDDKKLMKKGGKLKLTLGALSSTTTDPKVAAQFGNVVMRITVPKTSIIGTWRSGMGAEELNEAVVLGGKGAFDAEIVRVGKPTRMKAEDAGEDFVRSDVADGMLAPSPIPLSLIDENGWDRETMAKPPKAPKGDVTKEEAFDESKHPRAEDGKWTDGSQATKPPKTPDSLTQPSLPGMEGAGRTWEPENDADKVRQLFLEEERQTAIGLAQRDWDDLVGEEITVTGKGGWEGLSDDEKSEIQNQWENDNVEQFIEEETKEWQDSSEAQEKKQQEALEHFYDNVNESDVKEPVTDAIKEAFQGSQRQMDHFLENMDAMRLYQMGEAEDTREIEKHLDEIMGDQELEGDEQVATMDASGFAATIRSDYESRIESMMEDIEVEPDEDAKETINQNAYEAVSEAFHNSNVDLDDLAGGGNKEETYTVEEPKRWLLEQPTGDLTPGRMTTPEDRRQAERDYENTRKAAQALVGKRAEALWRERNPVAEGHEDSDYMPDFHVIGDEFWNDWKRDSNAEGTRGMQNALIGELGVNSLGRQGDTEPSGAQKVYAKALWQTTQFVLHKANMTEVHAYRAVMLSGDDLGRLKPTVETIVSGDKPGFEDPDKDKPGYTPPAPKKFAEFTDLELKQATAQSFTFDKSVANSWGGVGGVGRIKNPQRVVLRATVPPEAVWSLPVYGKNLQNENEVVILGTPWKKWEAWDKFAPDLDEVPIKRIQVSETPKPEKETATA